MFTKEKLEVWLLLLYDFHNDLIMQKESSSCVMERFVIEGRIRDLESLMATLEQLHTSITSDGSI